MTLSLLQCRAAAVPQMLNLCWNYHAIVVTAEIRQVTKRLECILRENEYAAGQSLETTEDLKDIFAII